MTLLELVGIPLGIAGIFFAATEAQNNARQLAIATETAQEQRLSVAYDTLANDSATPVQHWRAAEAIVRQTGAVRSVKTTCDPSEETILEYLEYRHPPSEHCGILDSPEFVGRPWEEDIFDTDSEFTIDEANGSQMDFQRPILRHGRISDSRFVFARLWGIMATSVFFERVDFRGAAIDFATSANVHFSGGTWRGANVSGDLAGVTLVAVEISGIDLCARECLSLSERTFEGAWFVSGQRPKNYQRYAGNVPLGYECSIEVVAELGRGALPDPDRCTAFFNTPEP